MAAGGLLSASLRDIEKQFGFTSKQSGFILISNDIAALLVVPLVSFLGEKGNKPKWIGYGTLLCGKNTDNNAPLILSFTFNFVQFILYY